jgi:hypothetical protein
MRVSQRIEQAATLMQVRLQSDKGSQSTLALRFIIDAAASAYCKRFGKPPGLSRSDYGTFGKFLDQIIRQIPKKWRPRRPSLSAINDAVKRWERPVARSSR